MCWGDIVLKSIYLLFNLYLISCLLNYYIAKISLCIDKYYVFIITQYYSHISKRRGWGGGRFFLKFWNALNFSFVTFVVFYIVVLWLMKVSICFDFCFFLRMTEMPVYLVYYSKLFKEICLFCGKSIYILSCL